MQKHCWGNKAKTNVMAGTCVENGSQRREFLEIDQPETRIAYGGHVC